NLINPLMSLVLPYQVPLLLLVTLRGAPDPATDEPQHAAMGQATEAILEACGTPHWTLNGTLEHLEQALDRVDDAHRERRPAAVLVPRGSVGRALREPAGDHPWTRREALEALRPHLENAAVCASTGYLARELFG